MKKPKKVKVPGAALADSVPQPPEPGGMDDYEAKGHLQDLIRAHEIMNDPEKMKKVHKLAGRHVAAIRGIQDIKDYTQAKYGGQANQMNKLAGGAGDGDEG